MPIQETDPRAIMQKQAPQVCIPTCVGSMSNRATAYPITWSGAGRERDVNRPCPAFRPGRFGLSLRCFRAKGVAWRWAARSNSARRSSNSASRRCNCSISASRCRSWDSNSAKRTSRGSGDGFKTLSELSIPSNVVHSPPLVHCPTDAFSWLFGTCGQH